jgi:sensor histidine kinase YesM
LKWFVHILSFFLLLILCGSSYGQQPSHFVIGEKELANSDVYSIYQGADEILYVTTNHGLFVYRYGEFQPIPKPKEHKGSSLFNLAADKNGNVYCANLIGQIFKLVNGKLQLYYELEKKYLGSGINFVFDESDNLLVTSKACVRFSGSKTEVLHHSGYSSLYNLNKLADGRIVISNGLKDSIIFIEKQGLKFHNLSATNNQYNSNPLEGITCLIQGGLANFYSDGTINFLEDNHLQNQVPLIEKERYVQFSEDEIWALGVTKGARVITVVDSVLVVKETYNNGFISAIAQGSNGTFFLGTFGQGIMVIPNRNVKEYNIKNISKNLRSIATDNNDNVFIMGNGKGVIHYKKTFRIIDTITDRASAKIFNTPGVDYGINDLFPSLIYDVDSIEGAPNLNGVTKDIFKTSETVIMATSLGITKNGNGKVLNDTCWQKFETGSWYKLKNMAERCRSVVYDMSHSKLYVANQSGTVKINAENQRRALLFNGKSVTSSNLLFYEGQLWCATLNYGILIYEDDKLIRQIDVSNGLGDNFINKIEIRNQHLFISHKSGFQVLNLLTDKWTTMGVAEGIVNNRVADFSVSNKELWLLSDNALHSIGLKDLPQHRPILKLHADSLVVSGKPTNLKTSGSFQYHQNHFKFHVDFRSVEYQQEATILHRIKGFETEWSRIPSTSSLIEYKSLPPGEYQFEVKVVYGNLSSEVLTYSFEIKPPFWQTWWFYLLVVLGFGILVAFAFLYQIKRIRKKNREKLEKQTIETNLLETQLKALRSQMNPHFIFNSLNSIQDLILQEDTEASYDYIVLFADLVRSTLNYSNKDFIPVEKELKFLEVYLSLEKLRFKDGFSYEIEYNGSKDIEVPSLIVQPFIENALIHGLLHKSGHKKLKIEFILKDQLTCIITDNGIGRKKAKEIQERQGSSHESFALEAIQQRLSILGEQHGENIGYIVHDLYSDDEPTGTKVEIIMPYTNRF